MITKLDNLLHFDLGGTLIDVAPHNSYTGTVCDYLVNLYRSLGFVEIDAEQYPFSSENHDIDLDEVKRAIRKSDSNLILVTNVSSDNVFEDSFSREFNKYSLLSWLQFGQSDKKQVVFITKGFEEYARNRQETISDYNEYCWTHFEAEVSPYKGDEVYDTKHYDYDRDAACANRDRWFEENHLGKVTDLVSNKDRKRADLKDDLANLYEKQASESKDQYQLAQMIANVNDSSIKEQLVAMYESKGADYDKTTAEIERINKELAKLD